MATVAGRPRGVSYAEDQPFFVRSSIVIAAVTISCFLQYAARGLVDLRAEPIWVHVHAAMMVSWLGFFVTQNILATGNVRLHRRLGKAGVVLAIVIVALGWFTAYKSFQLHHNLAGYNASWALAQESIATVAFLGLVLWGVTARRDPQFHRRLLLGATVFVAINPALSRALPPEFSGEPASGWAILAAEVVLLAVLVRHDRKVLGMIHPATVRIAGVITLGQVAMIELANSSVVQSMTQRII